MTTEHRRDQLESRPRIVRTSECLLQALDVIDEEGWDGPTGTALLSFIRSDLARPLAIECDLRGFVAAQAEASAWQAAWRVLTMPQLRVTDSPWGVVWRAARRAVHGEVAAASFGTSERHAWHLLAADGIPTPRLESLDKWAGAGLDAVSDEYLAVGVDFVVAQRRAEVALSRVGWSRNQAQDIVATAVDVQALPRDPRCTLVGWRTMADELRLPPWQARRLCIVLLGTPEWSGLIPRLLADGSAALREPGMHAALRSTRFRRHRSPVLAARRGAVAMATGRPQAAAS